ncbi:hypothetical protein FRC12_002584 [Ceratobasidium sp. 428]|nr:hypothetical protein FRC12_002584 [Ceratobasidium sp. 428]
MSRILHQSSYKPHTPPATPSPSPNQSASISSPPQSLDPLFTIQAQAERCRFLEHQLAAERQAQAGFIEESKVMQQTFQALSMAATQTQKQLEKERARASRAERRVQECENQQAELLILLEEERAKVESVNHKMGVLKGKLEKEGGLEARQLKAVAIERCKHQWDLFIRLVRSSNTEPMLSFENIPWPTFSLLLKPEDITKKEIERFIEALSASQPEKFKRKVKELLLVWHPDKFCGRLVQLLGSDEN